MNYYNENDPKAAAWLRELIKAGIIAPGEVDERSILDVRGGDLAGFCQCHFFAGIGGWSYALRLAGWPDDKPVWTGSCPCQPFSQSGKRLETKDARHLWPIFKNIIEFGEPAITFGEQVASPLGREWLAGVRDDLEGLGYEVGAADLCSPGVGAPHIRQRLYWVANSTNQNWRTGERGEETATRTNGERGRLPRIGGASLRLEQSEGDGWEQRRTESGGRGAESRCGAGGVGDSHERFHVEGEQKFNIASRADVLQNGHVRLVQSNGTGRNAGQPSSATTGHGSSVESAGDSSRMGDPNGSGSQGRHQRIVECDHQWPPGAPNLVVCCEDGKARRFEPGSFPLAHGVSNRVGLLRGYGNAIVPQVAAQFIQAATEAMTCSTQ